MDGVQQLFEDESADPLEGDEVLIRNESGMFANLGVGMSGNPAIIRDGVEGNANAQFIVTPTYYIGLFNRLYQGQIIKANVAVGPLKVVYDEGLTELDVVAKMDGENINIELGKS